MLAVVTPATSLARYVRSELRSVADPAIAPGQQAYMKSAMPYLGVRVPAVRAVVKRQCREVEDPDLLRTVSLTLWREAEYREERYAATAITRLPLLCDELGMLDVHEEMIRTGSWWDHVDEIAPRLGRLLRGNPDEMGDLIRRWSRDPDLWVRRASIISQLSSKDDTDRDLLADVVVPNLADPEFFIRKAIGWALRDFARTDSDWVQAFAAAHPLSPLSRREALKHVGA